MGEQLKEILAETQKSVDELLVAFGEDPKTPPQEVRPLTGLGGDDDDDDG
jgi:hypothetical protein